jgi:DNA repair exonuclease SbcCD ATPase subunit
MTNINSNEYENLNQIGDNHSQILSNNYQYSNKPTAELNKSKNTFTQREDVSNLINKILLNSPNNMNLYPQNQNILYEEPYSNIPLLENQLKQLKLNYIALNNDNIIYREDINKLMETNKKLEKELSDERNHNYELAKENDKLNNDNQNLFKRIDDVNQKITQIKIITQNEKDIMDKQVYFEEKINEKDFECKKLLEDNNKLNLDYNLLNNKYNKLKEKNNEEEKELNMLKQMQDKNINEIEKKLVLLIDEMNKLKYENNELKNQNEKYRNEINNSSREKNEYYNKYQEQKIKNDMINKEIGDIQFQYQELKKKLKNKENKKLVKENMRKNKSENKIKVIQDLQKRIQEYKTERAKIQSE